jgi:hypothetical protein
LIYLEGEKGMNCKNILIITLIALIILLSPQTGVKAAQYTVTSNLEEDHEVLMEDHNSYKLNSKGKEVEIRVDIKTGGRVDFYLFTQDQYGDYTNIFATDIGYVTISEKATSFSWSGSDVSYVFVVDNDYVSESGATPTNEVTYSVSIKYTEIDLMTSITSALCSGYGICGALILLAVGTTSWMYSVPKKYRENAKILKGMEK